MSGMQRNGDGPAEPHGADPREPGLGRRPAIRVPANPPRPEPNFAIPVEVLQRYNARVLDPTTALRLADQPPVRPTVYVGDTLLVSPKADHGTRGSLSEAAAKFGLQVSGDQPRYALRSPEVARRLEQDVSIPYRVRLVPNSREATPAADAWQVLQTLRGLVAGTNDVGAQQVHLDHLLTSAGPIGGSPYVFGHGVGATPYVFGHGEGSAQYGMPGWGGRQPVNWLGRLGPRSDFGDRRRPVVAVLDTGVGQHDWLPSDIVIPNPMVFDVPIADPEVTGVTGNPYEGLLDPDSGHGTFIAGLIRQQCPDADVLAIRIMGGDGVVAESNLLDALHMLVLRQQQAIAAGDQKSIIDVLSLSLGYYHEQPDDLAFDPQLLVPLQQLGALGVTVVAAAGNDATDRPCFPAAFAPWTGGVVTATDKGTLPVVSVGALNPNNTIALFSNAGAWVRCHRPGASLVSTYPTTINAAEQASIATFVPGDGVRSTTDPDDFTSGFAVWSGTSFAAPVLAGELAAQLCRADLSSSDTGAMVDRGWTALGACVPGLTP